MPRTQVIYADDADAFVEWTVTDSQGQTLDWADPRIAVGEGAYAVAAWQGVASPVRVIRLQTPSGLGLEPSTYSAYLKVPNGTDFLLGTVTVADRS